MTIITPITNGIGCADCAANTVSAAYSRNIDGSESGDCPVVAVELSLPLGAAEFELKRGCNVSTVWENCAMAKRNAGRNVSSEVAENVEFPVNTEVVDGAVSVEQADGAVSSESTTVADKSAVAKCTRYVEVSALFRSDNVRGSNDIKLPLIVASLRKNGFKPNHPLVVSKKADGRFLVLCGNRRLMGLEFIRTNHAEDYDRIVKGGKVPCIVHEGLTDCEEIIIRNDHSGDEDRVGLGDWGQFLAIKQLMRVFPNDSQATIAAKMGIYHVKGKKAGEPNRSFVQPRVELARLPIFVQDEFRKLWDDVDGKSKTPVRVEHIKILAETYRAEYAAYPDGNGPEFSAVWNKIMNPTVSAASSDSSGSAGDNGPRGLSVEAANNKGMSCASPLIKRILLSVTNQGNPVIPLTELDAQLVTLETDSQILANIRDYLGNTDFAELVEKSTPEDSAQPAATA
jgi:hypothetical protein